jgi:hypothetical protein
VVPHLTVTATELDLEVHEDPAHYVYFDRNGTGGILMGFSIRLMGYCLKNPSGAATAALDFYDGTDTTSAQPLFPITFAASESITDWFGPNGILLYNGIYVNVTSGEVKGSVFYRKHRQ